MTKPLVINGLHRSGTTMTERLFDSQPDMICFTLCFQIVRAIAHLRGFTDKGQIAFENFEAPPNIVGEKHLNTLRLLMVEDYFYRVYHNLNHEHFAGDKRDGLWGLSREELWKIGDIVSRQKNVCDVASVLMAIGQSLNLGVCATRWTMHHKYAPVFLRSPDAYWLEVVRNPYARISSERISHGGNLQVVLHQENQYLEFLSNFKHERLKLIRFEDLCNRTDETLAEISAWLGAPVTNVDLKNPRGGPFKPNSSSNVVKGNEIYTQDKNIRARVGSLDTNWWRQQSKQSDIAMISVAVNFGAHYERESLSLGAHVRARIRFFLLQAVGSMKRVIKGCLARTGFTVTRINWRTIADS